MITAILIGAGQRGAQVYAEYAAKYPHELKITAVAEPIEERRLEVCRRHSIPPENAVEDWRELLARPQMADCAMICTQDRFHTEPVLAALKAGYHVMCEKPMSPSAQECIQMGEYARQYGKSITVCHVLRYSPFFRELKRLLEAGVVGQLVAVQQIECVGYWHQAHSFVRGNWRNSGQTSPMILQKSCHDMDILNWLVGSRCKTVSSFGSLMHFRPENAPEGATEYCFDGCRAAADCPYYAGKIYLTDQGPHTETIRRVVALDGTRESVAKALQKGPYGRCVYACDNDVVDHQVVNLEFESGVTASFTMCAFTADGGRIVNLMGTRGQIKGDMERNRIEYTDFLTGNHTVIDVSVGGSGHNGSDDEFMRSFVRGLEQGGESLSSAQVSVDSHLMALAAEHSRVTGQTVSMEEFRAAMRGE